MIFRKEDYIQVSGEIFTAVQSGGVFKDSKTFVDSIPKIDPEQIKNLYKEEKLKRNFNLKTFTLSHFNAPSELEENIKLPENRTMREHIKLLWEVLKRKPDTNTNKYSTLVPLPKPYIIPGGRFREIYYWDSYFTMHGLLADGEIETVENMLDNFSYLINQFGFIPNGNRVYYLTRSQPPFFAAMVDLVCRYKNDYKWGLKYLKQLESEYTFWCGKDPDKLNEGEALNHIVGMGKRNYLNRYFDPPKLPREESYLEDVHTAQGFNKEDRENLYVHLRSAGESGWDFSSRWFADEKSLSSCIGTDIIPVDLNCLLFRLAELISELNDLKGEKGKSKKFRELSEKRAILINQIFWDDQKKFFFDYNWKLKKLTNVYSLAACFPLYFKIAEKEKAEAVNEKIKGDFLKGGGVLTTLNFTGQQWDAPNGWSPLQWLAIKGLRNYGFNKTADEIKKRWLNLNEKVFKSTGKMFEKYNVDDLSLVAGGGEYPLQDGFGWTNGIAAALLNDLDLKNLQG
jgi:alpha,alpha-trehalase